VVENAAAGPRNRKNGHAAPKKRINLLRQLLKLHRQPPASSLPYKPIDKKRKERTVRKAGTIFLRNSQNDIPNGTAQLETHRAKRAEVCWQNSRLTAGFNLVLKELVYPIYGARSAGSRVLGTQDGNEYIDYCDGLWS